MATPTPRPPSRWGSNARPALLLFGLGLLGVIAALPVSLDLVRDAMAALPDAPELSPAGEVALATLNPTLLLAAAVVLGLVFAPRVGLRSHLVAWSRGDGTPCTALRRELPLALGLGVAVGVSLAALDRLTAMLFVRELADLAWPAGRTLAVTLAGVLYGGITEELLLRWGIMSLLVWLLWRLTGRGAPRPTPTLAWVAIMVTAVAFGLLHLPALSAMAPLTAGLIARTVLLNAIGGAVYGWLFWRRSLESAMVAHAITHVAMSALALLPIG